MGGEGDAGDLDIGDLAALIGPGFEGARTIGYGAMSIYDAPVADTPGMEDLDALGGLIPADSPRPSGSHLPPGAVPGNDLLDPALGMADPTGDQALPPDAWDGATDAQEPPAEETSEEADHSESEDEAEGEDSDEWPEE